MPRAPRVLCAAAVTVFLSLSLAACQPDGGASPADPTGAPDDGATTIAPTDPADPSDPIGADAVADLAATLDVDPDDVEIGALERVTWSNGSLGCPQPGQAYTEALVDGYLLILVVDGTEYRYHGAMDGVLVYCATPEEPLETLVVE